jgi:hypothetical protein
MIDVVDDIHCCIQCFGNRFIINYAPLISLLLLLSQVTSHHALDFVSTYSLQPQLESSILVDQMCFDINRNTLMSLLPVTAVRWYLCIPMMALAAHRQLDRDSMNVVTQSGIAGSSSSSLTFEIFDPKSIKSREMSSYLKYKAQ